MDNILSWWIILSYILLSPFIHSLIYTLSLLYILLYTTLSYTQPRIFYTTLIYSLIYLLYAPFIYLLLYTPLYTLLYTLLFSNGIINLAPPFYTSPLSLLYTCHSYFHIPFIVIPTLLYRKGITTLPPIFTRFTSLS